MPVKPHCGYNHLKHTICCYNYYIYYTLKYSHVKLRGARMNSLQCIDKTNNYESDHDQHSC